MNVHKNARLTPRGREELVRQVRDGGRSARAVARDVMTTEKTVRKWVARDAAGEGLMDRSSRPHTHPHRTPAAVELRVKVLRQQARLTLKEIAARLGLSRATVGRIVARCGWSRLHVLELPPTSRRYEHPGLLHCDTKMFARIERPGHRVTGDRRDTVRGAGYQFAHVAVDDYSRVAYSEMLPDERGGTASGFLRRTVRGLRRLGVQVRVVMTDNGACYRSDRFATACRQLGLRHFFTRRYTPRTNGKAERFIKTSLFEWAYARVYRSSEERTRALDEWLHHYNWHRPHTAANGQPPITRVVSADNLVRLHS